MRLAALGCHWKSELQLAIVGSATTDLEAVQALLDGILPEGGEMVLEMPGVLYSFKRSLYGDRHLGVMSERAEAVNRSPTASPPPVDRPAPSPQRAVTRSHRRGASLQVLDTSRRVRQRTEARSHTRSPIEATTSTDCPPLPASQTPAAASSGAASSSFVTVGCGSLHPDERARVMRDYGQKICLRCNFAVATIAYQPCLHLTRCLTCATTDGWSSDAEVPPSRREAVGHSPLLSAPPSTLRTGPVPRVRRRAAQHGPADQLPVESHRLSRGLYI